MMKTRLYGLLALVLCAMMVAAPVAAMGASGQEVTYNDVEYTDICVDDIILDPTLGIRRNDNQVEFKLEYSNGSSQTVSNYMSAHFNALEENSGGWRVTSTHNYVTCLAAVPALTGSAAINNSDFFVYAFAEPFPFEDMSSVNIVQSLKAEAEKVIALNNLSNFEEPLYFELAPFTKIADDKAIRPADCSGFPLTITLSDSRLAGVDGKGYLIGAQYQNNGLVFDHQEVTINNGEWTATNIYHFSPYALVYQKTNTGTTVPGGPGDRIPAPAEPATPNIPQTGDNSQLALWFALAALSLAGAVLALRRRKA